MTKIRKTLLVVMLLSIALVGCSNNNGGEADTGNGDEKLKVAAVVNGNLGDKSFFDSLEKGLLELKDKHGIEIKVIETGFDETKWEPAIIDASEEDWDIIIAGTWQMADYVSKVADQYPEKRYIVYDTTVDYEGGANSNVYSIEYKQNEGAYLAGALAASLTETDKLGFVGGIDIPVINDFLVGYVHGAQTINPDIKVATAYIGDFSDTGTAKELGLAQVDLGVDIIFPSASIAGNGALEAAKEKGVNAIGVDSDQALLYAESNDEEMANLIYSSVLKEVGNSIIRAIELDMEDNLPWGTGEVLGVKEGAIGIAKSEYYEANVPEEVKEKINELEEQIKNGEIEVMSAFGMTGDELNDLRNTIKP